MDNSQQQQQLDFCKWRLNQLMQQQQEWKKSLETFHVQMQKLQQNCGSYQELQRENKQLRYTLTNMQTKLLFITNANQQLKESLAMNNKRLLQEKTKNDELKEKMHTLLFMNELHNVPNEYLLSQNALDEVVKNNLKSNQNKSFKSTLPKFEEDNKSNESLDKTQKGHDIGSEDSERSKSETPTSQDKQFQASPDSMDRLMCGDSDPDYQPEEESSSCATSNVSDESKDEKIQTKTLKSTQMDIDNEETINDN